MQARPLPADDRDAVEVRRLLEASGALTAGHFRLSSGRHSGHYVQCALLLEEPARAARVGELLAARLRQRVPDSVLSPALGGLVIGHAVAAALGVPFRFCERRGGTMELRRGFRLRPGERVAVIEDVITTGGSAAEAAALAATAGAEVAAIGAIILRGAAEGLSAEALSAAGLSSGVLSSAALSTALSTGPVGLLRLELASWRADACPLCAEGVPIAAPGSRPSAE